MAIYGTGLLAACLLAGLFAGELLGRLVGIEANIGGVGIAMILLILSAERMRKAGLLPEPTQSGIIFWSSVYIPVVVAMAGAVATAVCFALVPAIDKIGRGKKSIAPLP